MQKVERLRFRAEAGNAEATCMRFKEESATTKSKTQRALDFIISPPVAPVSSGVLAENAPLDGALARPGVLPGAGAGISMRTLSLRVPTIAEAKGPSIVSLAPTSLKSRPTRDVNPKDHKSASGDVPP